MRQLLQVATVQSFNLNNYFRLKVSRSFEIRLGFRVQKRNRANSGAGTDNS